MKSLVPSYLRSNERDGRLTNSVQYTDIEIDTSVNRLKRSGEKSRKHIVLYLSSFEMNGIGRGRAFFFASRANCMAWIVYSRLRFACSSFSCYLVWADAIYCNRPLDGNVTRYLFIDLGGTSAMLTSRGRRWWQVQSFLRCVEPAVSAFILCVVLALPTKDCKFLQRQFVLFPFSCFSCHQHRPTLKPPPRYLLLSALIIRLPDPRNFHTPNAFGS